MSIRSITVQYVGDVLFLPKLERDVKLVVERDYGTADPDKRFVMERTCRSTTDDSAWCFVCSECGKSFPRSQLHLAHNHGEINFCPNCGARVIV